MSIQTYALNRVRKLSRLETYESISAGGRLDLVCLTTWKAIDSVITSNTEKMFEAAKGTVARLRRIVTEEGFEFDELHEEEWSVLERKSVYEGASKRFMDELEFSSSWT